MWVHELRDGERDPEPGILNIYIGILMMSFLIIIIVSETAPLSFRVIIDNIPHIYDTARDTFIRGVKDFGIDLISR